MIKSLGNRRILFKATTRKTIRRLMTAGLPLMKIVVTPLARSVLIPLGRSAGMSAVDAAITKKIYGSDRRALIISNEEMNDILKIVKSLVESRLLIKGANKRI